VKQVSPPASVKIALRVEACNLFNPVNFTPPHANRDLASFGTIAETFDPRQVRLGAEAFW
jgi:hypothetical protein